MKVLCVITVVVLSASLGARAWAHCDGMDGPVVLAAQKALESGDVGLTLVWVGAKDEAEIRQSFARAVAVRGLNPQARELADRYFFETLVRVHRAGEGAPYTGLKPAGRDLGPAIPAADRALQTGDIGPLVELVVHAAEHGVRERFAAAKTAQHYDANDVAAGRGYVKAYVEFIHYVERLYEAAITHAHGHYGGDH